MSPPDTDDRAIRALIEAQFGALSWGRAQDPDFAGFVAAFRPDATLIPASRPAVPTTPAAFAQRMGALGEGELADFQERAAGIIIRRAGHVAVALAGCEMRENLTSVTRDVSAFLLVKEDDEWRIAAQAWDVVADFAALVT